MGLRYSRLDASGADPSLVKRMSRSVLDCWRIRMCSPGLKAIASGLYDRRDLMGLFRCGPVLLDPGLGVRKYRQLDLVEGTRPRDWSVTCFG
ncbi:MAG: hypothetical protein CM1200mP2_53270 [Planctomycetaceae bacterium]|nr:MAG: hypothetical protein CM1200mP2_53270 [Planctomycetaceae bacterium]